MQSYSTSYTWSCIKATASKIQMHGRIKALNSWCPVYAKAFKSRVSAHGAALIST